MLSRRGLLRAAAWLSLCLPAVTALATAPPSRLEKKNDNEDWPIPEVTGPGYRTEPDTTVITLDIQLLTDNLSRVSPGYIFFDPLIPVIPWAWGPKIYDINGYLVWDGNSTAINRVQDFHACDYLGQKGNHLCWNERWSDGTHPALGMKRIYDNTYQQVGYNYTDSGEHDRTKVDGHEFIVVNDGERFLQSMTWGRPSDLSHVHGQAEGWIRDGCFQEVDIRTSKVIFSWCTSDHADVDESFVLFHAPGQDAQCQRGAGGTMSAPWDFAHINSVDKDAEGSYLVSLRHLNQVLKVAGHDHPDGHAPGTVLWRLGGKRSDFKLKDFGFTRQHHARWVSQTSEYTHLSFLDNAWDGVCDPSRKSSIGFEVRIDHRSNEAVAWRRFKQPNGGLVAYTGNMQNLPNGNKFLGWGSLGEMTEYTPEGEILFHAKMLPENWSEELTEKPVGSYRIYKQPWVGKPHWPPKLLAYSRTCNAADGELAPLVAHVSWNGATEVRSWRFSAGLTEDGPWIPAGGAPKVAFETQATLMHADEFRDGIMRFARYVSVEALDVNGHVLGTTIAKTFVPKDSIRDKCDDFACDGMGRFGYDEKFSCGDECKTRSSPAVLFVFLFVALCECFGWSAGWVMEFATGRPRGRIRTRDVKYEIIDETSKE